MKRKTVKRGELGIYLRNFLFGVEDSLVSTVGLLSGVAAYGASRWSVFLTGVILIFVEALSMGIGSFLSEDFSQDYVGGKKERELSVYLGGLIMFVSYIVSGFIPIIPYLVFGPGEAFFYSILFSLLTLFLLGSLSARYFKAGILRHGLEMVFLGGVAISVGVGIGMVLKGVTPL